MLPFSHNLKIMVGKLNRIVFTLASVGHPSFFSFGLVSLLLLCVFPSTLACMRAALRLMIQIYLLMAWHAKQPADEKTNLSSQHICAQAKRRQMKAGRMARACSEQKNKNGSPLAHIIHDPGNGTKSRCRSGERQSGTPHLH